MAFAADTFASTTTADLGGQAASDGGTWTARDGTGNIGGDGAGGIKANASTRAGYYHSAVPASADYEVSLDVVVSASGKTSIGPAARMDTASNTQYYARWAGGTPGWELWKRVGGADTQLGSASNTNVPTAVKTATVGCNGSTIYLNVSGATNPLISVTDTAITAVGKAGVYDFFADTTAGSESGDNFSASAIAAAAAIGSPLQTSDHPGRSPGMGALGSGRFTQAPVSYDLNPKTANPPPQYIPNPLVLHPGRGPGFGMGSGRFLQPPQSRTTVPLTSTTILAPTVGAITIAGNAPAILKILAVAVGTVTIAGNTPAIKRTLVPAAGVQVISGNAPALTLKVAPAAAVITVGGNAPALTRTLVAAAGSVVIAGGVPIIVSTAPLPPAPPLVEEKPRPRQRSLTYAYDVEGLVTRGRISQKFHSLDRRIAREDEELLAMIPYFLKMLDDES